MLNIDFPVMRRRVMDLLASYGAEPDGLQDLFVLEIIDAGQALLDKRGSGKGADFLAAAHNLIRDIEIEGARKGELFAGIRDMLACLKGRDIRIGIATRNCLEAVTELFPDIHSFCDAVVTRESTRRVKPHPEHLRIVLRDLGAEAGFSAMVGDHPMDIRAGKEAGAYAIGVLTGYSEAKALSEAGADLIIESAAEIIHYLS